MRWSALSLVAVAATAAGPGAVSPRAALGQALAQAAAPEQPARRPKLALVLSGGGARGAAEIGALKVFEELHIVPDVIVGTSIGSIVGGLYATGWTPDEIEELLKTMDWNKLFSDAVDRREKTFRRKQDDLVILIQGSVRFDGLKPYLPPGLLGGQRMELFIRSLEIRSTGESDFDRFPIPYRAVATELGSGTPLVFSSGSLATAMRASMAIPGLFAPVDYEGHQLSDGGAVANLPVGIARALGAEDVIAVDITSPLSDFPEKGATFLETLDRMNSLLTYSNRLEDMKLLRPTDVYIRPDLAGLGFLAFDRAAEAVVKGAAATRAKTDELRRFSASDEEWAAFRARHHRRPPGDLIIGKVRVEDSSILDDRIVRQAIAVPLGKPLDLAALDENLMRVSAMGAFGLIRDGVGRENGTSDLVVETPGKTRGRGSLQLGVSFTDDFQGDTSYSITFLHRLLAVNRLNGEWANVVQVGNPGVLMSQFYQPLDTGLRWFVSPMIAAQQFRQSIFADGRQVAVYQMKEGNLRLGIGRVLGNWGEVRLDAYAGQNRGENVVGSDPFPDFNVRTGGLEAGFAVDTLDSTVFPTQGTLVTATYDASVDALGSEAAYRRSHLSALHAWTRGANTIQGYVEVGSNSDSPVPIFKLFALGGLGRLAGFAPNQFLGPNVGLARLLYYHRFVKVHVSSVRIRAYVGASLEAGNVFPEGTPVSMNTLLWSGGPFVAAETPAGPIILALGLAEGGAHRLQLVFGQRF